jgi:hypothetical protein
LKESELPVERYEENGSLTIVDGSGVLSKSDNVIDFMRYLMTTEMAAKKRGKQILEIIIDMGCFYHLERTEQLPKFEESIFARTYHSHLSFAAIW